MSLREKIRTGSAAARKTEPVHLPVTGVDVLVQGMMAGERSRVMGEGYDAKGKPNYTRLYPLVLGLCALDPETRKPIWNPNSAEDAEEINGMSGGDVDAIFEAALRLSGMDPEAQKRAEGNSEETAA